MVRERWSEGGRREGRRTSPVKREESARGRGKLRRKYEHTWNSRDDDCILLHLAPRFGLAFPSRLPHPFHLPYSNLPALELSSCSPPYPPAASSLVRLAPLNRLNRQRSAQVRIRRSRLPVPLCRAKGGIVGSVVRWWLPPPAPRARRC